MPEVQNIGAVDYAMPVAQNQYMSEPQLDENMPMVYDPDVEARKKASSNMLGLTLLGIAIAGGGLLAGRAWGKSGKAALQESNDAMKEVLKDINAEAKKFGETNPVKRAFKNGEFAKDIENKTKQYVDEVEVMAEDAAKSVEDAAEEAAKKST